MSSKVLYKAIDYLRLSKDDNEKSESNSIANQRLLINGERIGKITIDKFCL